MAAIRPPHRRAGISRVVRAARAPCANRANRAACAPRTACALRDARVSPICAATPHPLVVTNPGKVPWPVIFTDHGGPFPDNGATIPRGTDLGPMLRKLPVWLTWVETEPASRNPCRTPTPTGETWRRLTRQPPYRRRRYTDFREIGTGDENNSPFVGGWRFVDRNGNPVRCVRYGRTEYSAVTSRNLDQCSKFNLATGFRVHRTTGRRSPCRIRALHAGWTQQADHHDDWNRQR